MLFFWLISDGIHLTFFTHKLAIDEFVQFNLNQLVARIKQRNFLWEWSKECRLQICRIKKKKRFMRQVPHHTYSIIITYTTVHNWIYADARPCPNFAQQLTYILPLWCYRCPRSLCYFVEMGNCHRIYVHLCVNNWIRHSSWHTHQMMYTMRHNFIDITLILTWTNWK